MSHNATENSRIQTISPVDGSVYAEHPIASSSEIETKLAKAKSIQKQWKLVPVRERAAICRRMVSFLVERAEQLGTELTWQMGRPIRYSPMEIRRGFQERALYMIDIAEEELADIALPPKDNFRRFIRRDPIGLVLALMPWNYPYLCSVNAVVPAIMAGNTVILKPAMQTPLVARRYAEAFDQAGLPPASFRRCMSPTRMWSASSAIRGWDLSHSPVRSMAGTRCSARRESVLSVPASSWGVKIQPTFAPMLFLTKPSKTWWTASSSTVGNPAAQ